MRAVAELETHRQQKETLAAALLERRRRRVQGTDLLRWTIHHRRLLAPERPFDLAKHLYLRDIYNETARQVVVYKAGQMGASELLVSYGLHAADQRRATVLYVFPTDTHVSDFSSARIGPAIEASPYLASIVVEGSAAGGKRGANRVTLKRIRDRFFYLRGAKVDPQGQAAQLKSVDADVLILDEVDEMDPRAPSIAVKRLGHSDIGEIRWVSTPTYPSYGIHRKWLESDQREWHVRCESCGQWQPLTIHQAVLEWDQLERPVRWNGQDECTAWLACRRCNKPLNRLAPGQWVAAYPDRDLVGYHLTKLFGAVTNLRELVQALDTTDETERKEAFNQDLGEPYVPRGGQLTDEVLNDCRRDYAHGQAAGETTVAGCDVGKLLHVVIRGPVDVETGAWPQRWAGEVEGFEALGYLLDRFGIKTLVIDALPETRKARDLQGAFAPGRVWLAYYPTQPVGIKKVQPIQWDEEEWTAHLDRTRTLDATFAGFYQGTSTLPANADQVRDYYSQMKAPVRVLQDGPGGHKVAKYIEASADHFAHAENYCRAALSAPAAPGWAAYAKKRTEAMKDDQ